MDERNTLSRALLDARRYETDQSALILDRFSAEVFVNDGEKVMSMAVDTPVSADRVCFFADGAVRLSVKASHLTK